MPSTYTPIATNTLTSSTATVTFSSISGVYTDLIIALSAQDTGDTFSLRFNSDTGSNYSRTRLLGNGSVASSVSQANTTFITSNYVGAPPSGFSTSLVNINNYSNSTTFKTVLTRSGAASSGVSETVGLWRNTAAITSISILAGSNFEVGSTFTLYGIKAA
jgi:hypothetical protein